MKRGNLVLSLLAGTFLSTAAMASGGIYSIEEGTSSDYNFTAASSDAEGNITTKYYKIVLNPDKFGTSESIIWEEVGEGGADVIEVKLPNNEVKYFKYTYDKPAGYEETDVRINNTLGSSEVSDKVFTGISSSSNGGAIYNNADNSTVNINSDFIGNYVSRSGGYIYGGAIYNEYGASIGDITGDFIGNYAQANRILYGGAIYNDGIIGNITGDFIGNYAQSDSTAYGGAIYNYDIIGDISGDFIGNYAQSSGNAAGGGAIDNKGTINSITGDFIGNYAQADSGDTLGGAIYNDSNASIGDIVGNFIGNYASGLYSYGGAIYNRGTIGDITGDFIGNYAQSSGTATGGGAITNVSIIGDISGNFIGNYVQSDGVGSSYGGAIFNLMGSITSLSSNFIGNYAQSDSGTAYGGAIAAMANMDMSSSQSSISPFTIKSNGQNLLLSDNYTQDINGKTYNALHVMIMPENMLPSLGITDTDFTSATFDTSGGGSIVINDNIDGSLVDMNTMLPSEDRSEQYNLSFQGDDVVGQDGLTTQYVSVNNQIINAGKIEVSNTTLRFGAYQHADESADNWDGKGSFVSGGSVDVLPSLSLSNGVFDIHNGYTETINLSGLSSASLTRSNGSGYVHIDLDVSGETAVADVLNISGNVEGTTNVLVYANSEKDIRGESVLFAQSVNDTTGNADSFKVWRVYGSPYLFAVSYSNTGAESNEWSLSMNDTSNPDAGVFPGEEGGNDSGDRPSGSLGKTEVAPEVMAMGSLPIAGIEQTRNILSSISGAMKQGCVDKHVWVNPNYYGSSTEGLINQEGNIWGLEAGWDMQYNSNNRLGLFVSYRKGDYEADGEGRKYYSPTSSDIDINSYLIGLYYRYEKGGWYGLGSIYGGKQEAEITGDGVSGKTDGMELGAGMEVGYEYKLDKGISITPSVGIYYTQVSYDDMEDNVGKVAEYGDISQIEAEVGIKLSQSYKVIGGYADIYIKPSVVQTITDGGEVNISGLGEVESLDDMTLGRVEIGGYYGLSSACTAYGWANYTVGSDYDATTFGIGFNYAF